MNKQSSACTHIPIALPDLEREWDEAAAELAKALVPGKRKRIRERFGMSRELRSALTQFARVGRSIEKAAQFRCDYPNFFPTEFWNSWSQTPETPNEQLRRPLRFWRVWLKLLEQAWKADFHSDYVIQLNGALLSDPIMVKLPSAGSEPQIGVELPSSMRCVEIRSVYDFQRAVAAMGASPWRAKFCSKCGLPFVADKPQRDYCSDACRKIIHRMAWQERWERYGKKWRKAKRRRRSR